MFLVVDDHDMVLDGTLSRLQSRYPDTEIVTAQSAEDALKHLQSAAPDLLLLDLSIPQAEGEEAQVDVGLQLLRSLMTDYPELNITVQSSYAKALVRVVHNIESHAGGFTVASKTLPAQEMLARVDWALQGLTHTKDVDGMRAGLEIKPEWFEVLHLAFKAGLQDKAIAQRMSISERTVRLYWSKVYDVLGIYPEDGRRDGKNIRIQTEIKARELGLID